MKAPSCWTSTLVKEFDTAPRESARGGLVIRSPVTREDVADIAAQGLAALAANHDFGEQNQSDLNYPRKKARMMLEEATKAATFSDRDRADLLASLMSDAATKAHKDPDAAPIAPTPLCLLFGQGHQHFLDRFRNVSSEPASPQRGRGKTSLTLSAAECLFEALFASWHRSDPTFSFRWDPEEDVRYALMAGDPAAPTYKLDTQHGANRLAAVGLTSLTLAPETRAGRIRPSILGGSSDREGFSLTWPIWKEPATLSAIRSMLSHPDLHKACTNLPLRLLPFCPARLHRRLDTLPSRGGHNAALGRSWWSAPAFSPAADTLQSLDRSVKLAAV
jgi:hypothetical protein